MEDTMYCCRIKDVSQNHDVAIEFLSALIDDVSSWVDHETGVATHIIYAKNDEDARTWRQRIIAKLETWKEFGVHFESVEIMTLKREDWRDVWKKHFDVVRVSSRLVVKPSWRDFQPAKDDVVVEIDPGMSFGTGGHPTTRFCLRMIDETAALNGAGAFLDVGCGSGILTIAAAKLGFAPLTAIDNDPAAVNVAAENLSANGISPEIPRVTPEGPIALLKENQRYDLIAANILAPVLMELGDSLVGLLARNGRLILSGILVEEYDAVAKAFERRGCRSEKECEDGDWKSGLLVKT